MERIFEVKGMHCANCELLIENTLKKMKGVESVKASTASSQVKVGFNETLISERKIIEAIEKLDYQVVNQEKAQNKKPEVKNTVTQIVGFGIVVFALYFIIQNTIGFNFIPAVNQSMGYGILFVVGLFTSLHCVAMCGGINLSQCISKTGEANQNKFSGFLPSFLYNSGRVVSYTVIGGFIGAAGSLFHFSNIGKSAVVFIAGILMIVMGLNMAGLFPFLSKLNIRMPRFFGNKIMENRSRYGPFLVGLLSGLMPCGPLQTMQLYALGTGSFFSGALSMFFFSLGTVPLQFGLGAASSILSKKFTNSMFKASGVLVIVLGLILVNRGLSLFGKPSLIGNSSVRVAQIAGNEQVVRMEVGPNSYEPITVQKGIPVKWIVHADEKNLNGCNGTIVVPKYNIEKKLIAGDNIIEFTPQEDGTIGYSCWMGMIKSSIQVVPDITKIFDKKEGQISGNNISGRACCGGGN
jgi:sulfite exporter TauE/SafE/copper chaperone CopZ